ncbi:MAG: DUF4926 domain-containing protein [Bacillota bacterium]
MRQIQVDQRVRLTHDVPELELHRGEIGLVCSTWFSPATAYEVEFRHGLPSYGMRALLMSSQIQDVGPAAKAGGEQ